MFNYALKIAYDGTHYFGWQDSLQMASVEAALRSVIERIVQHKVSLQAASRTDRGVHARGQIVQFFSASELGMKFLASLNSLLAPDIRALDLFKMPPNFHPSLDAAWKEYCYLLCTQPCQMPHLRFTSWHYPRALDLEAMRQAASDLTGLHNFSAFCNRQKERRYANAQCRLFSLNISRLDECLLEIRLQGNRFLYNMARNIVGTLVYIGDGRLKRDCIKAILASLDRTLAGVTAPAHGLTLWRVQYVGKPSKQTKSPCQPDPSLKGEA